MDILVGRRLQIAEFRLQIQSCSQSAINLKSALCNLQSHGISCLVQRRVELLAQLVEHLLEIWRQRAHELYRAAVFRALEPPIRS
jgi:hypothetical protein